MFSYERAEVAVGCLTAHLETSWWCFLAQLSAQTVQPSSNPENRRKRTPVLLPGLPPRLRQAGRGPAEPELTVEGLGLTWWAVG